MESKEFRRLQCITAGAITLLEAVIWAVIAIYSIGVYDCVWEFPALQNGISSWSMLYIAYFMGGCKTSTDAATLGYQITPPTSATRNLQVWMWIYAIINAVWIPASALLIVAASYKMRGKKGAMMYYPWLGLTAVLIVTDLAGAIYHLVDAFNTKTPDSFATFIDSTSWSSLTTNAATTGVISWLPSLFVTLYFCRFLVFWVLNIVFIVFTYRATKAISVYKSKSIQSILATPERNKHWKDLETDPPQEQQAANNQPVTQLTEPEENDPNVVENALQTNVAKQESFPAMYKFDKWGIPIEEVDAPEADEETVVTQKEETSPRSPFQPTGRVFDFTGRPVRPESFSDRWQESAPPMASGVQVPPELNKQKPFSYTAGDQPQLMRSVSRSNSKASKSEYPNIPRPDYTIADRRSASLEFVPNRFKPKRPLQSQSSYESSASAPSSPKKVPPIPPKKPQVYPRSSIERSIPEDPRAIPQARYIPSGAIPNQQQAFYTRQSSQGNNYNINKMY